MKMKIVRKMNPKAKRIKHKKSGVENKKSRKKRNPLKVYSSFSNKLRHRKDFSKGL